MRNSFQIDKVQWMQHPILNLLIYSVSNVMVEKSSFILDLVTLASAQHLCMTITKSMCMKLKHRLTSHNPRQYELYEKYP